MYTVYTHHNSVNMNYK